MSSVCIGDREPKKAPYLRPSVHASQTQHAYPFKSKRYGGGSRRGGSLGVRGGSLGVRGGRCWTDPVYNRALSSGSKDTIQPVPSSSSGMGSWAPGGWQNSGSSTLRSGHDEHGNPYAARREMPGSASAESGNVQWHGSGSGSGRTGCGYFGPGGWHNTQPSEGHREFDPSKYDEYHEPSHAKPMRRQSYQDWGKSREHFAKFSKSARMTPFQRTLSKPKRSSRRTGHRRH